MLKIETRVCHSYCCMASNEMYESCYFPVLDRLKMFVCDE